MNGLRASLGDEQAVASQIWTWSLPASAGGGHLGLVEAIRQLTDEAGETTVPAHWVNLYESGLACYRARDFAAATQHFEAAIADRSHDQPSSIMIERCKQQLELPSGDDWDDTMIAQSK